MDLSASRSRFAYGCLGCVSLTVLMVGVVVGLAWSRARTERLEDRQLTRNLPAATARDSAVDDRKPGAAGPGPGRVVLDLSHADFEVEPAPEGVWFRVTASYDTRAYDLQDELVHDAAAGWTYHLRFQRLGSSVVTALKEAFSGNRPHVIIELPRGVPFALELNVREGGAQVETGGLHLTAADVVMDKGGLLFRVGEPQPWPMEHFAVHGRMGGMQIESLGNASPSLVRVDFGMGGMELDLRGAWVQDAEIEIATRMGGSTVRLPRDVIIEGSGALRIPSPARSELPLPRLSISTTALIGGVQFQE